MKSLDIIDCSNYLVDEFGGVYSRFSNRFLKPATDKDGYLKYTLTGDDGCPKYWRCHRLVAAAYCKDCDYSLVVNHKDGNIKNNFYKNLEWVTISENTSHSYANGLQKVNRGYAVNDIELVHEVCRLLEQGCKYNEIFDITGMDKKKISEIKNKTYWKYISDDYNFAKSPIRSQRISLAKVNSVCILLEKRVSTKQIIKETGVSQTSVYKIKNRKTFSDISKGYEF